jgi:hypothetical protein
VSKLLQVMLGWRRRPHLGWILYMIMSFTGGDALVGRGAHRRAIGMFVVTEADGFCRRFSVGRGVA